MIKPELITQLSTPCLEDTILEVRTSRMKVLAGTNVESGIDKEIRDEVLYLTKDGFDDDEHDLTFHGGPDKAILGYCSTHYPEWREIYPERSEVFVPGGFGENFVFANMNERNVHIGDIVKVGGKAVMQIALPRTPCYKLNHRFHLKNFAPETYKSSRTGWYYRVLEEGPVTVGDKVTLLDRPWPKWPIERVQEYLHRNTSDEGMNEELAAIDAMGNEARNHFIRRYEKAQQNAKGAEDAAQYREFQITARKMETPRIVNLAFKAVTPDPSQPGSLGPCSHVELKLPNGLTRSYSVVSSKSGDHFVLGVALDNNSRGGSRYLHEEAKCGQKVSVRTFSKSLDKFRAASHHVFIVGGIGITAFLDLMAKFVLANLSFELHYAVRSGDDVPFGEHLKDLGDEVTMYDGSKGERMDIPNIVKMLPWNTHLYVCGPDKMMKAARAATNEAGLGDDDVHWEAFSADASGDPFEVEVTNKANKILKVGAKESLLEVLRQEFGDVPASCEVGNCGTCIVNVKCGRVEHRGVALSAEEKESSMLSCVSRGIGRVTIEM